MKAIDEIEKWPEIGSRAGAVKSCVSLLSAVCGQPETVMERWLDLYYQVRHAQEKADVAARAAEMYRVSPEKDRFVEAAMKASVEKITKRLQEELKIPENGGQMTPDSAMYDEAASEPGLKQEPAPPPEKKAEKEDGKAKTEPEPPPENRVKRPGGKGKPRPQAVGNTISHDSAVFKRQVRDRLEAVRKKGVSAPEIVKAAPAGSVKESDVYMILQGYVIKIDIYRALDEALRHFEN